MSSASAVARLLALGLIGLGPGATAAPAALSAPASLAAARDDDDDDDRPALAVPRFPIPSSPIGLTGDARPRQYLGVLGRKAAWLGSETGEAELWVHPLKLASGFHLDFRITEYDAPVRGADVARRVEVRPELTTITYSHATFTVRQHILAPLDEPGLVVLLEVDTYRPLDVIVSFRTVFQEAWPGGFGGQSAFWDDAARAFVLSESRGAQNALIGSPWARSGTAHAAHALPDAPSQVVIPIDPARAAREMVPIAIAVGKASRDDVRALYASLIRRAPALLAERVRHAESLRTELVRIDSPDDRLDLAFEWAKVNLDEQKVCNPDLGCGLVAGWGPSGEGLRPGFGWFFGGDAAINSFAMSLLGMHEEVAEGLRFLARYQREDGKIPHEVSQSAGRIPWFTDFPYAYYHADTTPFWLVALWRWYQAHPEEGVVQELWPAAKKAWAFCRAADRDGDGLMENTAAGLGAIEVGEIGEDIHQDVYLAAVSALAAQAMADLARGRGEEALAAEAKAVAVKAEASLRDRYWLEAAGHHAFGVLRSGRTNDTLTVWPATAAAFGLLDGPRAGRTLAALASHRITADWGARMLSVQSPLYDPTHYNMGAVWPFVTGFLSWGHFRYGRPWAGYPLVEAVARMAFDFSRGRHPELLSGAYYRPLDTAVPQQFFATSMLVTPLLAGLVGFEPGHEVWLRPALPAHWDRLSVKGLPTGSIERPHLDVTLRRGSGRLEIDLTPSGRKILLAPHLPPGARNVRIFGAIAREVGPLGLRAEVAAGARGATVVFTWKGGLEPEPPLAELVPGQSDEGLRILDWQAEAAGYRAEVEGLAGRSYELVVRGESIGAVTGADVLKRVGERTTLRVAFPSGEGWRRATLSFRGL